MGNNMTNGTIIPPPVNLTTVDCQAIGVSTLFGLVQIAIAPGTCEDGDQFECYNDTHARYANYTSSDCTGDPDFTAYIYDGMVADLDGSITTYSVQCGSEFDDCAIETSTRKYSSNDGTCATADLNETEYDAWVGGFCNKFLGWAFMYECDEDGVTKKAWTTSNGTCDGDPDITQTETDMANCTADSNEIETVTSYYCEVPEEDDDDQAAHIKPIFIALLALVFTVAVL